MKNKFRDYALWLCLLIIIGNSFSGCATIPFRYLTGKNRVALPERFPPYPASEFIIFSDPHLDSRKKETSIEDNHSGDRMGKMLSESWEILEAAKDLICKLPGNFVLIPGDLTERGNSSDHSRFVQILNKIEQTGKQVYVIPGNHDLKPKESAIGEKFVSTKEEFAELYKEFGYGQALFRDDHSLSYVAEPVLGLWLLALDATSYENSDKKVKKYNYGKFSPPTLFWIEDMLERAALEKKRVIVMLHYALLEHFKEQKGLFPAYVIDDFEQVARLLVNYKVEIVFTGHFHSQDITLKRFAKNGFLFDIETGSLVTFPCAFRKVKINEKQKMEITTYHIEATASHNQDFLLHAKKYLEKSIELYFDPLLKKYGFSAEEERILLPQLSRAMIAHACGDEKPPDPILNLEGITPFHKSMINMRKKQFEYLWTDLIPPDNNICLDLINGEWEALVTR
jgi:UDP-2,3-diacylglucosamine pyrophosphatase LpxH